MPIEAIELSRRSESGCDARVRGEAVLEGGAIGVVEADHAREAADRVVDDDVRRDHHVARGGDAVARVREQDAGGAERVRDDRVERADAAATSAIASARSVR